MVQEDKIQSLVSAAKQGDSAAFGEIFDSLSPFVYNFIFAKVRHKQTAEDLLQTVFVKAWNNISRYEMRPNAKFSTWMFQIANYTLIDHWRTRKETVEIEKVENFSQFAGDQKLYENYSYLWEAIGRLSDDYQTVLDLRFRQELSVGETAYAMGKSEVGIRVLQHRALKALRKQLEKMNKI